ncbi:PilN domain-containing protein [Paracidovorax sp. MALMAid1276]|uniref:PilN domain-containing protein n=1 Tax=Paracidovorax sp. MALMAid1276 TaxID=3411631 RepID=UPI003B9B6AB3
MATLQTDARLFGLDLSAWVADGRAAWREMVRWPVIAWLRPEPLVRWVRADGRLDAYQGPGRPVQPHAARARTARFEALEVPEAVLLRHEVRLPPMGADATLGALRLAVQALSPFPDDDLLWVRASAAAEPTGAMASAESGQQRIPVVLTSRRLVQQALPALAAAAGAGERLPELWVASPSGQPVILPGFGEQARARYQRRWYEVNLGLLVTSVALLAAIAVTPTLQLRSRALDAQAQYRALQQQAAPLVQQREAFVKADTLLQGLSDAVGPTASALQVMELITKALPDDAVLQSFQMLPADGPGKMPKLLLAGQASNAAALMQQLGNQPGLRDVKAPSPAVKPLGAIKESFTIEMTVDLPGLASSGGKP